MAGFANANAYLEIPVSKELFWLAGVLEAEGTFLRPPPSMPNCPIVSCRMTDRDVVAQVAKLFGTRVMTNDKGHYRTEYAATLKGSGAVALMTDIKPLMGSRRQQAIESAIQDYAPPRRKLTLSKAEEIRRRFANGESVATLAISYRVARQTIYPILQRRIYSTPTSRLWRKPKVVLAETSPPSGMSPEELFWLAGWLEGEGSFLAPPPSDPRRPRISAPTRDHDVATEAARLCRVTPSHDRSQRILDRGWSPTWRVLLRGSQAIALMQALEPLMGIRRRNQIHSALKAAKQAGNKALLESDQTLGRYCAKQTRSYGGGRNRTGVRGRSAKASTGIAGA
jgi:Helix-turn-helix domain of resolvase